MAEAAPDIVIYGSPVSPFVRKVAAVCIEKGIDFELDAVNVFDPPDWFREISPLKRIPVLRDRSIAAEGVAGTIADSSAISAYLEKKRPDPALYPQDAYAHGRALFVEEFADSSVAATGGLGIFRAIYFNAMQGKDPDLDTARKTWNEQMPPLLKWLNDALGDDEFYAGGALSIADITVACVLAQIALVADMSLGNYPAVEAHYDRMNSRPSIAGPFAKADGFIRKTLPDRFDLT